MPTDSRAHPVQQLPILLVPGPRTQDGLLLGEVDPEQGRD